MVGVSRPPGPSPWGHRTQLWECVPPWTEVMPETCQRRSPTEARGKRSFLPPEVSFLRPDGGGSSVSVIVLRSWASVRAHPGPEDVRSQQSGHPIVFSPHVQGFWFVCHPS